MKKTFHFFLKPVLFLVPLFLAWGLAWAVSVQSGATVSRPKPKGPLVQITPDPDAFTTVSDETNDVVLKNEIDPDWVENPPPLIDPGPDSELDPQVSPPSLK